MVDIRDGQSYFDLRQAQLESDFLARQDYKRQAFESRVAQKKLSLALQMQQMPNPFQRGQLDRFDEDSMRYTFDSQQQKAETKFYIEQDDRQVTYDMKADNLYNTINKTPVGKIPRVQSYEGLAEPPSNRTTQAPQGLGRLLSVFNPFPGINPPGWRYRLRAAPARGPSTDGA